MYVIKTSTKSSQTSLIIFILSRSKAIPLSCKAVRGSLIVYAMLSTLSFFSVVHSKPLSRFISSEMFQIFPRSIGLFTIVIDTEKRIAKKKILELRVSRAHRHGRDKNRLSINGCVEMPKNK